MDKNHKKLIDIAKHLGINHTDPYVIAKKMEYSTDMMFRYNINDLDDDFILYICNVMSFIYNNYYSYQLYNFASKAIIYCELKKETIQSLLKIVPKEYIIVDRFQQRYYALSLSFIRYFSDKIDFKILMDNPNISSKIKEKFKLWI